MVQLTGTINQNQNAPPSLAENGTVNTFNRVPAGALAPGMIVEVYGTGLATVKGNTSGLPLPTSFQGTSLIVGLLSGSAVLRQRRSGQRPVRRRVSPESAIPGDRNAEWSLCRCPS